MNTDLLNRLKEITEEECAILSGKNEIDRSIYMRENSREIDCDLLLERGKLITLRPHTRFIHFPAHTHNYVEMIYMCQGQTHHIINDTEVVLKKGELLVLSQNAIQEIYPAKEDDIAVNFIILPQFFDMAIHMIDEENNPIRDFLVNCLCGNKNNVNYLHFSVDNILPIQNLLENLIWTLVNHQSNKRSINQLTMGLLFLQLANHTETLKINPCMPEKRLALEVLRYIEEHYFDGTLREFSDSLHYDMCWLSREIKKQTGKTFTELIQDKRLNQAAFLLKTTEMKVFEIAESVGYENLSYFHRIFQKKFSISPHKYRNCK
ncbi:MAG: AraC family transcriptional regulator [Clostridia bacterium]|nr:AraC family transcriptional regulator [Clostridia bacterium]